jgi:RNA-directed DNA polymerase
MIVEGRAWQEGVVQVRTREPHTEVGNSSGRSDERGQDPKPSRARIAARARVNPKEKFTSLLHHLTPELIKECLQKTPLSSATGTDGMTVSQARQNLDWLLPDILKQIHDGRYKAPAVRRVHIPKPDGRQRPIGVPQVVDRAIQAGAAAILNEIYEQDFLQCSFGFRPGLGCHHALATINELMYGRGMSFALEVDIRDFFGSLDHGWLRRFLELRIGDKRMLKLIESWLRAGVMEDGRWRPSEVGTPQGGSVSPILANVYLHYVLDLWFEKKIKRQLAGDAHLVRYCDDFVILFRRQEDVDNVRTLLKARLAQFGLVMADEKTHKTDLTPRPRGEGADRRRMSFLGFDIFRSKRRDGNGWRTTFQTEGKRFSRAKHRMKEQLHRMMHRDVGDQAERINAILRGHFNYYGIAGNGRRITTYYYEVVCYWRKCLSKRSQRGEITWTKMRKLLSQNPLHPPRIRLTYRDLATYARL